MGCWFNYLYCSVLNWSRRECNHKYLDRSYSKYYSFYRVLFCKYILSMVIANSTNTGVGGGRIELLCYHKFMRKLLLLLFLFTLTSNALAKVKKRNYHG